MKTAIDSPEDWVGVLVEVLRDYGRPMFQSEASRIAAKICGISIVRMPYVVDLAIKDGLIVRGDFDRRELLHLVETL
ncbi:hypothetical protein SEA_CECE_119 [Microbacterium phage Cece]|nr:hypothetical protein SEA_CECE_119 [Microbacterium phage Cece]